MESDPPSGPVPPEPAPAPDDPLVGTVLADRYRIVRKLGEGGMGAVYMGEHLRFGRFDAIKVLRDTMSRDPESTERFLRGARNASAIQHPNVCTVYDFSDVDGVQFLAMEYVEGETLADVLERDGPQPVQRTLELMRQVAAALGAAHELGIVHRDLKPGNVMLARTRDGGERVKVVDFDIAKGSAEGEARDVTRAGFVVGTPEYMSPEQLTGDPLDGRSDLYSLGIVLFRTLTGSIPSRAANTQDLMVERLTADPLRLAEVAPERPFPPGVQELVDGLLQRRREDRFGSADEVVRAIETVMGGGRIDPGARIGSSAPAAAGPGPAPAAGGAAGRPGGGGRWTLAAVGGGAVAAAVLVFAVLWPGSGASPSDVDGAREAMAGEGTAAEEPGAGEDPGALSEGSVAGSEGDGSGDAGEPVDRGGDEEEADRTGVGEGGNAGVGEGGDSGPALTIAMAEELLFRQLELLDEEGVPPARLSAGEDTVRLVWELPGLGSENRGFAAYVMGNLLVARGDTPGAVRWLERAVAARPGYEPYRDLLARLRGGA